MKTIPLNFTLYQATLLQYGNNRFVAKIIFRNNIIECYIPCSSKLSKYLKLENVPCLIKKSFGKYTYSLFAIKVKHQYIIVDTKAINKILGNELYKNNILYEKNIENFNYKSDIFIPPNMISEIKSIISTKKSSEYPDSNSIRFYTQLKIFDKLLLKYKVNLIFVFFAYSNNFHFSVKYNTLLSHLNKQGLVIKFYKCYLNTNLKEVRLYKINKKIINWQLNVCLS